MSDEKSIEKMDWNDELAKREISHIQAGDYIINDEGRIYKVVGFKMDEYGKRPSFHCEYYWSGRDEPSYTTVEMDKVALNGEYSPKWRKMYADTDTVFMDAVQNINAPDDDEDKIDNTTTTLTVASGKDTVDAHKRILQEKENRLKVMEWVMKRKMYALQSKATIMKRQLKYTQQVIRLMELFLGVYEQIVTLREGQPAPADFPINIRQLVLYMDEEVGSVQFMNGQHGIDFQSIEEFDKWLLSDQKHIDLVIPEAKGIVALRPTRQEREYSPHFLVNLSMKDKNTFMYLLIRNGEQLYRVYTDVRVGERLFPTQEEMDEVFEELSQAEELSRQEEQARDKEMTWRYKSALIQGLFERTSVLHPLPSPDVSLFNPDSFERGDITLIRDAEDINLPDGRMSFKQWREEANAGIKVGSRVVITDARKYKYRANRWRERRESDAWAWRFGGNYYHWTPDVPDDGVYVVTEAKLMTPYYYSNEVMCYRIMYMPSDRMDNYKRELRWGDNPSEPRRQGFWLRADDEFMLNYEAFNMEDIEYYVNNRIYRRNYLSVIPQLFNLRDMRLAEIEEEKQLVTNFALRYDVDENDVWEALEWWKTKNKLQRPMREDESKAWRMIRRHLGIKSER